MLPFVLLGCSDPDAPSGTSKSQAETSSGTADGSGTEDSMSGASQSSAAQESSSSTTSGLEDPFTVLNNCDESDLAALPWSGPAFAEETGELLEPLSPPYIIATTVGWAKDDAESIEVLDGLTGTIVENVFTHEGFLGGTFGGSQACSAARTITLWRNREAMMGFVLSGPHLAAIPKTVLTMQAFETVSWEETQSTVPPTWEIANARLVEEHGG